MQWEKKICIRITARRILGAVLTASTVVNMVIVGAAFEASAPISTSTLASLPTLPPSTTAFFMHASTAEAEIPVTGIETPGTTPTQLLSPMDKPISSSGWIVCIKKFYWSDYLVQPGDTLYSLAAASGSTVEELMLANCLTDDRINYGQLLYMPRLLSNTFTPTPTSTSTATQTPTGTPTITLTDTPTPTLTDTPTVTPSVTPTSTPTDTPTFTPTYTPTVTPTYTPTDTLTPTLIYTETPTPTNTPDIRLTIGPNLTSSVVPVAN